MPLINGIPPADLANPYWAERAGFINSPIETGFELKRELDPAPPQAQLATAMPAANAANDALGGTVSRTPDGGGTNADAIAVAQVKMNAERTMDYVKTFVFVAVLLLSAISLAVAIAKK